MALTNHERVGKAMELQRAGLAPFACGRLPGSRAQAVDRVSPKAVTLF